MEGGCQKGRDSGERVDLDKTDQPTGQRMPEGDRAGVVPDSAQPRCPFADGVPLGDRLHGHRVTDGAADQSHGEQTHSQGAIEFGGSHDDQQYEHVDHDTDDDVIEHGTENAQADRGWRKVEGHGLAGDQIVLADTEYGSCGLAQGTKSIGSTADGTYSGLVDLDAYVAAHTHVWARLEELVKQRGRLDGAESDELLELYQRTATHLSEIRSTCPDPTVVAHLSSVLARARSRAVGSRTAAWQDFVRFFVTTFPAALYRTRRWWLVTMVACVAMSFLVGWYFYVTPSLESTLASPQEINDLVTHDFENYYSEYAASSFAFRVWTNNVFVAALCIAFGVFGFPVVTLLWNNLLNVAIIGSIMWRYERADLFFGLILPHGLLELTAVFVAGGVGLRIFWSWVAPGPRSRMTALAQETRAAMSVSLGLLVILFVTGIIEGYVTPSTLPTWTRIGIGIWAELLFFAYVFIVGRHAVRAGATGDIDAIDQGDAAPVAG